MAESVEARRQLPKVSNRLMVHLTIRSRIICRLKFPISLKINNGHPELTPTLGKAQMELVSIGLGATVSADLWGGARICCCM